ncbi:hypothetical protein [Crenobacter cavernae]|uniref:hypothetical protein n=1 Tax=Crenobacter cavernae TaxID=2290923 RepID=UPI0011C017DC|nr:hypothetical protein [Crenobacter cavernae]
MLSKSDLQSLLQCPRKLWLEHHHPGLAPIDDPQSYRRVRDGNQVGEKARKQLGRNILWPQSSDHPSEAAANARHLLAQYPDIPAVEVPMEHDGLYARADALIPLGNSYVLQETKASSFPLKDDKITLDKPQEHHLDDLAIQAWIMWKSGLPIAHTELNLLNNRWRYPGGGITQGCFDSWM